MSAIFITFPFDNVPIARTGKNSKMHAGNSDLPRAATVFVRPGTRARGRRPRQPCSSEAIYLVGRSTTLGAADVAFRNVAFRNGADLGGAIGKSDGERSRLDRAGGHA